MDRISELQELRLENEMLRRENEAYRAEILQYTMERAIGDDHLSQKLSGQMQQFYPEPTGPRYCMVLFHGGASQTEPVTSPISATSSAFRNILTEFGQPFFFETIGTVCCLLNFHPDRGVGSGGPCADLTDALSRALGPLSAVSGARQISISMVSDLDRGPRMLYRDACLVYATRTPSSPPVCTSRDQPRSPGNQQDHLIALEPLFWKQIQQQRFFDAATTLDQMIEQSLISRVSLEQTLASVFTRMEAILQICMHTDGDPGKQNEFTSLLSQLSQAKTYYEIRICAYDILALLEDQFYTSKENRNRKMPAIEQYIHQHYADPSLGTALISGEFKISTSYLARIFKADKGISVTDYIHSVRTDAAKELLRTTTLSLDEVASKVGFSNRWVLIRIFKNQMGITPGRYKEFIR